MRRWITGLSASPCGIRISFPQKHVDCSSKLRAETDIEALARKRAVFLAAFLGNASNCMVPMHGGESFGRPIRSFRPGRYGNMALDKSL